MVGFFVNPFEYRPGDFMQTLSKPTETIILPGKSTDLITSLLQTVTQTTEINQLA